MTLHAVDFDLDAVGRIMAPELAYADGGLEGLWLDTRAGQAEITIDRSDLQLAVVFRIAGVLLSRVDLVHGDIVFEARLGAMDSPGLRDAWLFLTDKDNEPGRQRRRGEFLRTQPLAKIFAVTGNMDSHVAFVCTDVKAFLQRR